MESQRKRRPLESDQIADHGGHAVPVSAGVVGRSRLHPLERFAELSGPRGRTVLGIVRKESFGPHRRRLVEPEVGSCGVRLADARPRVIEGLDQVEELMSGGDPHLRVLRDPVEVELEVAVIVAPGGGDRFPETFGPERTDDDADRPPGTAAVAESQLLNVRVRLLEIAPQDLRFGAVVPPDRVVDPEVPRPGVDRGIGERSTHRQVHDLVVSRASPDSPRVRLRSGKNHGEKSLFVGRFLETPGDLGLPKTANEHVFADGDEGLRRRTGRGSAGKPQRQRLIEHGGEPLDAAGGGAVGEGHVAGPGHDLDLRRGSERAGRHLDRQERGLQHAPFGPDCGRPDRFLRRIRRFSRTVVAGAAHQQGEDRYQRRPCETSCQRATTRILQRNEHYGLLGCAAPALEPGRGFSIVSRRRRRSC